ncbi:MAG: hypothetical protein JSS27_07190 [Planctomycetes bacterium]|nr:hypothetical protein [Planctomycetota bacterium]
MKALATNPHPSLDQVPKGSSKGGAPKGNGNSIRSGLTAALATGNLPRGCGWVRALVKGLKRALEAAVVTNKGQLSIYDAALIQTACRWEQHALLAQRWLRLEGVAMNADQRLAYSRDVARSSAERDKCLKALGLEKPLNVLDALYSDPPSEGEPQATEPN